MSSRFEGGQNDLNLGVFRKLPRRFHVKLTQNHRADARERGDSARIGGGAPIVGAPVHARGLT